MALKPSLMILKQMQKRNLVQKVIPYQADFPIHNFQLSKAKSLGLNFFFYIVRFANASHHYRLPTPQKVFINIWAIFNTTLITFYISMLLLPSSGWFKNYPACFHANMKCTCLQNVLGSRTEICVQLCLSTNHHLSV